MPRTERARGAAPQDICVGDFWETEERRGISTFTTTIAEDKFQLVTTARPMTAGSMFKFISAFDVSKSAFLSSRKKILSIIQRHTKHAAPHTLCIFNIMQRDINMQQRDRKRACWSDLVDTSKMKNFARHRRTKLYPSEHTAVPLL